MHHFWRIKSIILIALLNALICNGQAIAQAPPPFDPQSRSNAEPRGRCARMRRKLRSSSDYSAAYGYDIGNNYPVYGPSGGGTRYNQGWNIADFTMLCQVNG